MKLYAGKIVFSSDYIEENSSLVLIDQGDSAREQDISFEKAII